jgi:hypothetical protein
MNCSRNFNGSNAIGNGEVDSSILSGSTIHLAENIILLLAYLCPCFPLIFEGTTA